MSDLKLPEINACQFVGRIVRDPELKHLESGTALLKFSIACDRRYKKGSEYVKEAVFPSIVVWGKHAEYMNDRLKKGMAVMVVGARMEQRKWKDKEDRQQHATEYVVDGMAGRVYELEWADKDDKPAPKSAPADDNDGPPYTENDEDTF